MRRNGVAYDWSSMEVDDRLLSVKLTQREQGPAICSKVNGKETRWEGDTAQRGWMRQRERKKNGGLTMKDRRMEVDGTKQGGNQGQSRSPNEMEG